MKVEPLLYGDRKVYAVSAFNRGVASWVARLPSLWIEGEVTEFRRQPGWQSVFFTLKDPTDGSCLPVSMPRGRFDGLRLELTDGMSVHVFGRPELYEARGVFQLRALSIEPLSGSYKRQSSLASVVLPAPFCPTIASEEPAGITSEKCSSTGSLAFG